MLCIKDKDNEIDLRMPPHILEEDLDEVLKAIKELKLERTS